MRRSLDFWKTRLGLDDWDIQISEDNSLPSEEGQVVLGQVHYDMAHARAVIHLLSGDGYETSPADNLTPPYDPEMSLVHELLHLRFPGITDKAGETRRMLMELGINRVAEALVDFSRHCHGDTTWMSDDGTTRILPADPGRIEKARRSVSSMVEEA